MEDLVVVVGAGGEGAEVLAGLWFWRCQFLRDWLRERDDGDWEGKNVLLERGRGRALLLLYPEPRC